MTTLQEKLRDVLINAGFDEKELKPGGKDMPLLVGLVRAAESHYKIHQRIVDGLEKWTHTPDGIGSPSFEKVLNYLGKIGSKQKT